jgi:opacity protein-like surface antigen
MMKRALVGIALAAMVVVPASSQAQRRAATSQPINFSIGAGVAMPMSDWSDAVGTGFHLEGVGTKKLNASPVFVRGEAAFTLFGSKEYANSGIKGSGSQIAGMADLGYNFASSSSVKPYVLGGLGLHHSTFKISADGESASDSKDELGVNLGGGMRFKMAGRVAYLEARYISAGDVKSLPIGFGLEF